MAIDPDVQVLLDDITTRLGVLEAAVPPDVTDLENRVAALEAALQGVNVSTDPFQ